MVCICIVADEDVGSCLPWWSMPTRMYVFCFVYFLWRRIIKNMLWFDLLFFNIINILRSNCCGNEVILCLKIYSNCFNFSHITRLTFICLWVGHHKVTDSTMYKIKSLEINSWVGGTLSNRFNWLIILNPRTHPSTNNWIASRVKNCGLETKKKLTTCPQSPNDMGV